MTMLPTPADNRLTHIPRADARMDRRAAGDEPRLYFALNQCFGGLVELFGGKFLGDFCVA
jgi:hypothetical protein